MELSWDNFNNTDESKKFRNLESNRKIISNIEYIALKDTKYGIFNSLKNEFILKPNYDNIYYYLSNCFLVDSENKKGFFNRKFVKMNSDFDSFEPIHKEYIKLNKGKSSYIFNLETFKYVHEDSFDSVKFIYNVLIVKKNDKYGISDFAKILNPDYALGFVMKRNLAK